MNRISLISLICFMTLTTIVMSSENPQIKQRSIEEAAATVESRIVSVPVKNKIKLVKNKKRTCFMACRDL